MVAIMTPTAEEIVESTVWKDAMEEAHAHLILDFEAAPPGDAETLADIAYMLHALATVRAHVERRMLQTSINS